MAQPHIPPFDNVPTVYSNAFTYVKQIEFLAEQVVDLQTRVAELESMLLFQQTISEMTPDP